MDHQICYFLRFSKTSIGPFAQVLNDPWITMFGQLPMLTQYNAQYFAAEGDESSMQGEGELLDILAEAEARTMAGSATTSSSFNAVLPSGLAANDISTAEPAVMRGGDGSSSSSLWDSSGHRSYRTLDPDDSRCHHTRLGA